MKIKLSQLRKIIRENIEVDPGAVERAMGSLNAAVQAITDAENALEGTYVEHPHSQVRTFSSRLMWLGHTIKKMQADLGKTLTHGVERGIAP